MQNKTNSVNHYSNTFHFYDLDFLNKEYNDIQFYKSIIVGSYDEVLELCCGTGRLSIPLAQENIRLFSLDVSLSMLGLLKRKIGNKKFSRNLSIVNADIIDFNLNHKFKCILIANHSFQNLTKKEDIVQCLKNIHYHLDKEGDLILNIFIPFSNMATVEGLKEKTILKDETGVDFCLKETENYSVDIQDQIIKFRIKYEMFNESKTILIDTFEVKYYYPNQIVKLLLDNNFIIKSKYYGFTGSKINSNREQELTLICIKK